MPELPEVETIVKSLKPHVVGRTIIGIVVRDTRPLQQTTVAVSYTHLTLPTILRV